MYVLIVYDVAVERVTKVHKCLKRFLHWRQNSVFEGELTDAQIENVRNDLRKIIDDEIDSILLYIARDARWLKRESLGQDKNSTDNLL
ncbi:MAG: CRISPR-associated endonuclease Cas2 [Pyrinomonadaceae bacterium]